MFKKVCEKVKTIGAGIGVAMVPMVARAEGWDPTVTLDTAPLFTIAGAVVAGLAAIWGIRKVIKLMNRS